MVVSLLELCVRSAIDNLQYISDVGETDIQLLKRILPHCNAEQLNHIESSTKVFFPATIPPNFDASRLSMGSIECVHPNFH